LPCQYHPTNSPHFCSAVSTIPPTLHTSVPLSVPSHQSSTLLLPCQYHPTNAPPFCSPVSTIPPTLHTSVPLSVPFHQHSTLLFPCQHHSTIPQNTSLTTDRRPFKPTLSTNERPQTHALDAAACFCRWRKK